MTIQPFALLPDPELIEACLKGSGQAWEALLVRYQRLIYSIPLRYGLPEHDANDVFQNVSLLLWENLGRVRDRARLGAWLMITTRRECWRMMRQRRQNMMSLEGGALDELLPAGTYSEDEFLLLEQQSLVRAAIGYLGTPCRELLTLLFYADPRPAYSEIARNLTLPEGSIGPTRSRCLEKLMKILENMGFADA
jgi:RNA polymerase sigma factor (sigma-70 family)